MRFDQNFLDEIRARLPVSQVVSRHVRLKRQGREFIGLSPFKSEKTPSFTVNDQKGFFHCFASGEHGDIFGFLMKIEGLSFPEAVERLAKETGVRLPEVTVKDAQQDGLRARLLAVVEASARFFESNLRGPDGTPARDYLQDRGVSPKLQKQFRIGYAPDKRFTLKEHLIGMGFSLQEMNMSGMLVSGEDISVPYDRFRNRIVFPITNLRDQVIAFGGRALSADQPAKYLNSPETPLFHKGAVLFNCSSARQSSYQSGNVIVVEGYMDVIALSGAGFENVVAPLGTALTEDQFKLLWRLAPEPILCLDGDSAGLKAAHRAVETILPLLRPGYSARFVLLPGGQDPDDLISSEGPSALQDLLVHSEPLSDVLWKKEWEAGIWDTPERRAALEQRLYQLVGTIRDLSVRRHYESNIRERLYSAWQKRNNFKKMPLKSGYRKWPSSQNQSGRRSNGFQRSEPFGSKKPPFESGSASQSLANSQMITGKLGEMSNRDAVILATMLNHPWILDEFIEEIAALIFDSPGAERLRDNILDVHARRNPLDRESLSTQLSEKGLGVMVARVSRTLTHKSDWFTEPSASVSDVKKGWLHILERNRELSLKRELKIAQDAWLEDLTEENQNRIVNVSRELLNMNNSESSIDQSEDDPESV